MPDYQKRRQRQLKMKAMILPLLARLNLTRNIDFQRIIAPDKREMDTIRFTIMSNPTEVEWIV